MSIGDFGAVSLALTFVYFTVSLQRSAIGDSSLIFSPSHKGVPRAAVRWTLLNAAFVFVVMTVVSLVFPMIYPFFLPFLGGILVAQDGLRYGLVAIGKPISLVVGDVLWVANSGAILILMGFAGLSLLTAFQMWIVFAIATCLYLWFEFHSAAPVGNSLAAFGRITSRVSGWSALQFMLGNGSVQAALTLFALAVGANSFAGFRATQMVLSPLIVGTLALSSPLLSFIVARSKGGWSKAHAFQSSAVFALIVGCLAGVAVWQGRWLIELVPGVQYVEYSNLLLPGAVALVFVAANVPLASSLLSRLRGRAFFLASVAATVPTSALVVWAAFTGGTEFAVWAMAFQYAAVTVSCAVTLAFTATGETRTRKYLNAGTPT